MRSIISGVLAVAAFAAPPAVAKDKKPVDPDKKICRRYETTGSLMPSKAVCHTAAEWTAIDTQNGETAQGIQQQSRHVLGGN